MHLAFQCPACSRSVISDVSAVTGQIECSCGWQRSLSAGDWKEDGPAVCMACGNQDLWRQKDFPQRIGLLIIAVQVVLTSLFWAWHRPIWTYATLIGFAILDMVLYAVLPDVLVCYRCRARHRTTGGSDRSSFDLETAERYRQERLRSSAS